MKKCLLICVFVLLGISLIISFVEGITIEEKQIIKNRIKANDPGRDLLIDQLLRETNGEEINFVLPYLNDSRADVRAVVAEKLGFYGDASIAVPALLKAREDKDLGVKFAVVQALLNRGYEKEIKEPLIELIRELYSRSKVIDMISNLEDKELRNDIREVLENLRNNKEFQVINQAYYSLILSLNFQVPLRENKVIILKAIKEKTLSSDNKSLNTINTIIRGIGAIGKRDPNQKECSVEMLKEAEKTTRKEISDTARIWLEVLERGK